MLQERCVKCSVSHEKGGCKVTDKEELVCANCHEKGHPANYKGCKKYKDYRSFYKGKIISAQEQKKISNAWSHSQNISNISKVTSGLTFANVLAGKSNPADLQNVGNVNNKKKHFQENPLDKFFSLSNELFGQDFGSLMGEVEIALKTIESLSTVQEKRIAYLNFSTKIINEGLYK